VPTEIKAYAQYRSEVGKKVVRILEFLKYAVEWLLYSSTSQGL
jgi:hypothetical protein